MNIKLIEKYNFSRKEYQSEHIPLLMGNGDMGGLADKLGGGFSRLWLSGLWESNYERSSLDGPLCTCDKFIPKNDNFINYSQELLIGQCVLDTVIESITGESYHSTVFFSLCNKKMLLIRIRNTSRIGVLKWNINLPLRGYTIKEFPDHIVGTSVDETFTRSAWSAYFSLPFLNISDGKYEISIEAEQEFVLIFSVDTALGTEDFNLDNLCFSKENPDFNQLLNEHKDEWEKLWQNTGSIKIPDEALEKLFYRSLFFTFCVSGCRKYLPGEQQFVEPSWDMRPFTYGAAGWTVLALIAVGHENKAKEILELHFKPEALKQNAAFYLKEAGKICNNNEWSFAHEVGIDGICLHSWHMQRHIDAFASSLFHIFNECYPNTEFLKTRTYPVMRGTAEFWSSMVTWDCGLNSYVLPVLRSLSEDLIEPSVLDAVLAAKWNLLIAARYARELNQDLELADKWDHIGHTIYVPQEDSEFLEYLGDKRLREGAGYFGVRAPVYLAYPTRELIFVLDRRKILQTLDSTWERNKEGYGMITFVANWFALAEAHMNRGDQALKIVSYCLENLDSTETAIYEVKMNENSPKPYFLTSHTSFVVVQVSLLLQSYDKRIMAFPAVPTTWKDVSFEDLPAVSGIRVSGQIKGGKVVFISYKLNGKELLNLNERKTVRVEAKDDGVALIVEAD